MYFTRLPDHSDPGFDVQLHFERFKQHNIIFDATSKKSYCERHVGCLSVKSVLNGEEWYGIDSRRVAVRPGQFLILNDEQEYSSSVDSPVETRVVSVFFKREFALSVFRDAMHREETALDNPHEPGVKPLEFFQTLYDADASIQKNLIRLLSSLRMYGYEKAMVEESLFFLLSDLIRFHKIEMSHAGEVRAVRPGTRVEIYRRICAARDFLHSSYMEKIDLSDIGKAACLSVPQLIRQFKSAFGATPRQYLTRIRLTQAAKLLEHTRTPVYEIAWQCGFENVSAFCRAFKAVHNVQPGRLRRAE